MVQPSTQALCYFVNHHRLGASIVVDTGTILPVFAKNYYNPLCFIQYPDPEVPPVQWEKVSTTALVHKCTSCIVISTNVQVSIMFAGNRAIIGSAIYANNLDLCSWYSFEPPYFYTNRSDILRWRAMSYEYESIYF